MKVLPWFRMYTEFATDPVIVTLAFEDQRHFVMLLCFKGSGLLDREFPSPERRNQIICAALGLDPIAGAEAKRRLMDAALILDDWQPRNWNKRQFSSDGSTDRVRKFRGKQNRNDSVTLHETLHETEPKRSCNALDQIRADTEQSKKRTRAKSSKRAPESFSPDLDYASSQIPDIDAQAEADKFRDWEFKNPRSDWPATWRNWIRTCKESGKYVRKSAGPAPMIFAGQPVKWQ